MHSGDGGKNRDIEFMSDCHCEKAPIKHPSSMGLALFSSFSQSQVIFSIFLLVQFTNNIISLHSHSQESPGRPARPPTHLHNWPGRIGWPSGWFPQPQSFPVWHLSLFDWQKFTQMWWPVVTSDCWKYCIHSFSCSHTFLGLADQFPLHIQPLSLHLCVNHLLSRVSSQFDFRLHNNPCNGSCDPHSTVQGDQNTTEKCCV